MMTDKDKSQSLLFRDWNQARWSNKCIKRHLVKACSTLEIPRLRIHNLQHSFCSIFLERGGPMRLCQEIAGHDSVEVTERYAHVGKNSLMQATSIME